MYVEGQFPEEKVNRITDEIFGKQIDSTYCEGLVDAESEKVFYQWIYDKQLLLRRTQKGMSWMHSRSF